MLMRFFLCTLFLWLSACSADDADTTGSGPVEDTAVSDPEDASPWHCDDGEDNDLDALVDCEDPDCADSSYCTEWVEDGDCADGEDNDEDGAIDCEDSDCADSEDCEISESEDPDSGECEDGQDNDGDQEKSAKDAENGDSENRDPASKSSGEQEQDEETTA